MQRLLISLLLAGAMGMVGCDRGPSTSAPAKVKIGFLVKQPEEKWFQNEWKFAQKAADQHGFELVKIGATDGGKVMSGIDNLGAQGAKGFVICTPDVRLGPAIVMRAKRYDMKVFSVDDQFLDADGKFMDVHHMGISAREIGRMMGVALWKQMQERKWPIEQTGLCVPTWDQLDTARQRTEGAIEELVKAGFPAAQVFKAAQKTTDIPGGRDAANIVLTQHADVKYWLVAGMNDAAVLGTVRAMEGRSIPVANVIGIGIGGDTCLVDFEKAEPTGFYASVLVSPMRHGFESAELLYKWIAQGVEPPKTTYTTGILIRRDNYRQVLKEQGLAD
jgi:L-arabinose transport system substrate-binding protein